MQRRYPKTSSYLFSAHFLPKPIQLQYLQLILFQSAFILKTTRYLFFNKGIFSKSSLKHKYTSKNVVSVSNLLVLHQLINIADSGYSLIIQYKKQSVLYCDINEVPLHRGNNPDNTYNGLRCIASCPLQHPALYVISSQSCKLLLLFIYLLVQQIDEISSSKFSLISSNGHFFIVGIFRVCICPRL